MLCGGAARANRRRELFLNLHALDCGGWKSCGKKAMVMASDEVHESYLRSLQKYQAAIAQNRDTTAAFVEFLTAERALLSVTDDKPGNGPATVS